MGMVATIWSPFAFTITGTVAAGADATAEEITEVLGLGTDATPGASVCICIIGQENLGKTIWA